MIPTMYEVVSRHEESERVVTLGLRPADGELPVPEPGQFNMLWVFGVGEVPISLAEAIDGVSYYTIRREGAVTEALCSSAVGDPVGIRGPFGEPWDLSRAEGRDVMIVAGGLGLAPLRYLIDELVAHRSKFGRVALLIGSKSPDELLYPKLVESWGEHIDVAVTVDNPTPAWQADGGRVGLVTELIPPADVRSSDTTAFVCGPEIMMRFSAQAMVERGIPADEIFLSIERNMHCAVGLCGHCQLDTFFICRDGPVLAWPRVEQILKVSDR